jgi:hypothetical protein
MYDEWDDDGGVGDEDDRFEVEDDPNLASIESPFGLTDEGDRLSWAEQHLQYGTGDSQMWAALIFVLDSEWSPRDPRPARAASLLAARGQKEMLEWARLNQASKRPVGSERDARVDDSYLSWAAIGRELWKYEGGKILKGMTAQGIQQRCDRDADARRSK